MRQAWDKATNGQSKPAVTILNCTWADLDRPGAMRKHADAAERAYQGFKDQSYDGPTIMVMVDSSARANDQMIARAKADADFFYFHIPTRHDLDPAVVTEYPQAVARIPTDASFQSKEFLSELAWVRQIIDLDAANPIDNSRPPLGSKRNFGIEVGKSILAKRGLQSDVIVYMDDDVYGPQYVNNAVQGLQGNNQFTAEVSYYMAYPVVNRQERPSYDVRYAQYLFGQQPENYTWLNDEGHDSAGTTEIHCTLPFGFTYAFKTQAWEKVGGIPNILRGEDRSLFIRIADTYGQDAINLRQGISGQLVRLLGDNNSHNAMSARKSMMPSALKAQAGAVLNDAWKELLEHKWLTAKPAVQHAATAVDHSFAFANRTGRPANRIAG